MSSKVWSIGIQKHKKMISAQCLYQIRVHDRNEINSMDDHRVLVVHSRYFFLIDRKGLWIAC